MFTALMMAGYITIWLFGLLFVGVVVHHRVKTYMDRKHAELAGEVQPEAPSELPEGGGHTVYGKGQGGKGNGNG